MLRLLGLVNDALQVADLLHELRRARLELLELKLLEQQSSLEFDVVGVKLVIKVCGAQELLYFFRGHQSGPALQMKIGEIDLVGTVSRSLLLRLFVIENHGSES